jgi:hypothetical protein
MPGAVVRVEIVFTKLPALVAPPVIPGSGTSDHFRNPLDFK